MGSYYDSIKFNARVMLNVASSRAGRVAGLA